MSDPDTRGCEFDQGEEVGVVLFEAGGDCFCNRAVSVKSFLIGHVTELVLLSVVGTAAAT